MFNTIYYWDNSSNKCMIEFDLETDSDNIQSVETIKKVHEFFKKGYVKKEEIDNKEFNLLIEHLTASAYRHYLINRKPFIILKIKYEKLSVFEIKCIFEYLMSTDIYKDAIKHKDIILPVKLGWWTLKDIISKYEKIVKLGMDDYSYCGDYDW